MISFTAVGLKLFKKSVANKNKRLKKLSTANARAAIVVGKWIQKNLESEGATVGVWEGLAESTVRARRSGKKKSKGHKILQNTGQLKSRWDHYWNNRYAKVTSGVPYARYHDSAEPRSGKLPRRQILPSEKQIFPELKKVYSNFVRTSVKGA